jgi:hypothetical protein
MALVELSQRQFAPACGRSINAAKDGPTPAPGLVFCEAGFFIVLGVLVRRV